MAPRVGFMRARANRFLTDTCEIVGYTSSIDSEGGQSDTWEVAGQGVKVACTVSSTGLTPEERVIVQRLATERTYAITLPAGTAITARDRVLWDGRIFEVRHPGGQTNEILRRVVAEEIL